jgi:hypothetical protein
MSPKLMREFVAALNAGPASTPPAWEFSEPIEVTLLSQRGLHSGVDLATGRCLTNSNPEPPFTREEPFAVDRTMYEWMLANGLDLTALWGSSTTYNMLPCQLATSLLYVQGASEATLQTITTNAYVITAADVAYNWDLMTMNERQSSIGFGFLAPGMPKELQLYLFRTRKGCLGIVEILKAPANPHEVIVRYKRVQPSGTVRLTQEKLPNEHQPWIVSAGDPGNKASNDSYKASVDHAITHSGKANMRFESSVPAPVGYARMTQSFKAEAYRGKRFRYSGYVRTQDVMDWAGLFFRVDGTNGNCIAIDNMQNRGINGTTDWTKHQIVMDVPEAAIGVEIGLILTGGGKTWIDDLSFEVVGKDVPTTVGLPDAPSLKIQE